MERPAFQAEEGVQLRVFSIMSVVLVLNKNIYIDIKPYFAFRIDPLMLKYWGMRFFPEGDLPNCFMRFSRFPKRKQIWCES